MLINEVFKYFFTRYIINKTSLNQYLINKNFTELEGNISHCQPKMNDLINLVQSHTITSVLEIGFNAGHSAELFLCSNPNINMVSFDLGFHDYVLEAKKYIDIKYPLRHTLILGDSTITLPKFISENQNMKFDLIFIDGGHEYIVANSDLENCRNLAHQDTIVIIDDTMYEKCWEMAFTTGPTRAWIENVGNNKISEINRKDYSPGMGISWGKYIFN